MKTVLTGTHIGLVSNVAASGVSYIDTGGLFGGGTLTLEQILAIIGSGTLTGAYLTVVGGEVHTIDTSHPTLSGTATFDLADGNVHPGTLTADTTITVVGWTNGKGCYTRLSITGDGASTPTIAGVTWIGSAPGVIGAGDVLHMSLFSDDGGTIIYGVVVGGGGLDTSLETVAASGAAQTIDVSVARTYDITKTANVTYSLTGAVTGEAWYVSVWSRNDASARTETWPGSVVWVTSDGLAPPPPTGANETHVVTLVSFDGGTVWTGFPAGGGGSAIEVLDEGVSLTAALASIDFVGAGVTATTSGDDVTITIPGATTSDIQLASPPHAHVAQEQHSSDGATVTFTLDQTYEPGSVMAWNLTTSVRLSVTEVLPDQATISAAGAAGNVLCFDYAASLT